MATKSLNLDLLCCASPKLTGVLQASFETQGDLSPVTLETITILKSQYEQLLREAQQFANLKLSLLKGGVSVANLDVLINETLTPVSSTTDGLYENDFQSQTWRLQTCETRTNQTTPTESSDQESDFFINGKEGYSRNAESEETDKDFVQVEQRTVDIKCLPDRTTHLDLTNEIRAGAILEIYLKSFEHSARVSFTESSAAREFMSYTKRNGFYVSGKKVEISWAERQFFLRPYIKQNIDHGASRNLVIRSVNPNITASLIRNHLDHIHNLVVIDIRFNQGNAYISTNSVHNAMFARSCMMSRTTYKGMRIEFDTDACARPFQKIEKTFKDMKPLKPVKHPAKPTSLLSNRFEMLNFHELEDSDESEVDDNAGISIPSKFEKIDFGNLGSKRGGVAV